MADNISPALQFKLVVGDRDPAGADWSGEVSLSVQQRDVIDVK
jgi:hypothetical protein